jgi:hypothetical protein
VDSVCSAGLTLLRAKLDSEQPLKSLAFTDVTCTRKQTHIQCLQTRSPHTSIDMHAHQAM